MPYIEGMTFTHNSTDLVRVADAVRQTGIRVTPYHVTRLIRMGKIPGQRIGALWYVRPGDLLAVLMPASGGSVQ